MLEHATSAAAIWNGKQYKSNKSRLIQKESHLVYNLYSSLIGFIFTTFIIQDIQITTTDILTEDNNYDET